MPQFDATIKHIKDGVKGFTVKAAVTNIEGWEATLEKTDTPAAKTIVKDLENLKKHLQAEKVNGQEAHAEARQGDRDDRRQNGGQECGEDQGARRGPEPHGRGSRRGVSRRGFALLPPAGEGA